MRTLTAEGRSIVEGVAHRNNVGTDAVMALLQALERGGGTQAQFSHFELGGMGQWSRGGMIMIGDMFNNGLKYRVDQLCTELSDILRTQSLFEPEPSHASWGGGMGNGGNWWPASCGIPSSSGSQNNMRYACFPDTRRLAIERNGQLSVYDTGDHRINGFSQQQSDTQNLTFTSQYGTVRLYDLGLITGDPAPRNDSSYAPPPSFAPPNEPAWAPQQQNRQPEPSFQPAPRQTDTSREDMFAKIERLHDLHQKGILSEAEFSAKKKELLDRL